MDAKANLMVGMAEAGEGTPSLPRLVPMQDEYGGEKYYE